MAFTKKPVNTGERTIIENQAITRLKQGDLTGLEVIVKLYQVKAVHAAVLIVYDREVAEEIVEDAFFRAAQKIHQFDERRPFGPWFLRSVINASLLEIKRQKRTVSIEETSDKEIGQIAEWLVDPGKCPEELVEDEHVYEMVWKALDQLPPEQRAAIIMRYIQNQSELEITEQVHRPLTTVKWWLRDARNRLRQILRKDYPFENDQEVHHE